MSEQSLPPPSGPPLPAPPAPAAPAPASPEPRQGLLEALLHPGGRIPGSAPWGPGGALLAIVFAVCITVAGGILLVPFTGTDGLDATLANQIVLSLAFVGAALAVARQSGAGPAPWQALGVRRPARSDWAALTVQAFLVVVVFAFLFTRLAQPEQTDAADELGFNVSVAGAIVAGLAIVLVAPFCEEVFFRGMLFAGLRRRLPFLAAAVLSGACFGAIHLVTGNVAATIQLAVLGMVLAWLYERSGSLWAPMSLHAVNNAVAFTLLVTS